jgi:hypothetical protein
LGTLAFRGDLGPLQVQRNKNPKFVAPAQENGAALFAVQRSLHCNR